MQGVQVDRERDKDGPVGRDSIGGGVSRAVRKSRPHDQGTNERSDGASEAERTGKASESGRVCAKD